ncbi:nitrate reductase alpha subunit [Caldalkalibacillus uzonensis]|uniref:nitrate reductase (quinone) n=1 Tax=Caldalkalibacillus uzonensis TaxID=353224 RepID=A0ABU0CRN1_9BACI|nr:nitrate reductase subunit alpha [Caldalkalibacillus uzonensis]MDQ0339088.1 nitrate reductase alpha subunit [Caldalkalibacillus uzonensis]
MSRKISPLLQKLRYFGKSEKPASHAELSPYGREIEKVYRRRWQHDKVVRTTHGVNCTGSCSWKVYVKDGIITWETQQIDYPSTGPGMPEYEPRGCPRGATFSWYTYSPLRVRYPYVRGALLNLWKKELRKTNDPVAAWRSIVEDPDKAKRYKAARGKGGFVRATWDDVNTLISASLIYTIQQYGPDRIFGFSPIPAMSMVSYAGGGRFLNLIGGSLLSFYDWYADLPPASPQVWGEQTDVPESSDWFNSSYMLVWGSNIPQTRTPDAHFYIEARYKGTKVVAVSPDYAEFVKFADNWLAVQPGMDGALAMAMTHVILKEFYVDEQTEYFQDYVKKFTDLPYLVTLKKQGDSYVAHRFLRASDLGMPLSNAEWKTVVWDEKSQRFAVPNGSIGHRWENEGKWNLHLEDSANQLTEIQPALTLLGHEDDVLTLKFPHFEPETKTVLERAVPVKALEQEGQTLYVTTVFDLLLAKTGVSRGLPGDYPADYDDPKPYTPAWQEALTGIDRKLAAQIAREFAQNAIDSKGRSMIVMGSGINHWYHSDAIYRTVLNLVLLTGSQGVNGGGWAHYVGQEKVRPLEGWQTIAMARDWGGPPRLQNGTSFFYFVTEQWKYDDQAMNNLVSPLVDKPRYQHGGDYNYLAARLGWLPSYPQFNANSIKLYEQSGAKSNEEAVQFVVDQVKAGRLKFAIENPSDPQNFPRVLFVWRANLIGSSAKGHEYFLKHLLGTHHATLSEQNKDLTTSEIDWSGDSPEGKLDLLVNIDFRMNGTGLYSDIVLPAATWYEKYDLSSTDLHPFVHPFNPAIAPPWQSRSDWDFFKGLAQTFSRLAKNYFNGPVKDIVATPLLHDTRDELAQPYGEVYDWKDGQHEPVPGVNFPRLHVVERDYTQVYDKFIALGPVIREQIGAKGLGWKADKEYDKLKQMLGTAETARYKDCPSLFTDRDAAEAILTLSSSTNGSMALKAWEVAESKTGQKLKDLVKERAEEHLTFDMITAQPRQVLTTPVYSGTETGNRRYSPFTTNVERLIPWRTLTGRQHFYLDHELMLEFGEELPTFKAPLRKASFYDSDRKPQIKGKEIALRYLTPHYKWSYHSTYWDTLPMLTLFRGGPHVWLNNKDAEEVGIADNDWLEMYNRNGVVVARAVVSHRLPRGVAFMYHVQDRYINVPGSPISKLRGGTFNSPTRIHVKPTQMVGGYAQLSYGFNYYGPTGNQRDEQVLIRRLDKEEVDWLED